MSLAIGHFAAGASATFVVLNMLPPRLRRKVPDYGFLGILAGLAAMLPDLSKFAAQLRGFHDSAWSNLFFLHYLMDNLDVGDSAWISALLVGIMIILMLVLWAGDFWRRREK
jgi:hypothetical protein